MYNDTQFLASDSYMADLHAYTNVLAGDCVDSMVCGFGDFNRACDSSSPNPRAVPCRRLLGSTRIHIPLCVNGGRHSDNANIRDGADLSASSSVESIDAIAIARSPVCCSDC